MFKVLFLDGAYGWSVDRNYEQLSFICEIPLIDVYKIAEEERDFGKCCCWLYDKLFSHCVDLLTLVHCQSVLVYQPIF